MRTAASLAILACGMAAALWLRTPPAAPEGAGAATAIGLVAGSLAAGLLIDRSRRPGRFLILGSASPDLKRQASESLAGRIVYHELAPLTLAEVGDDPGQSAKASYQLSTGAVGVVVTGAGLGLVGTF